MLNLKDVGKLIESIEGLDFQQMNDSMVQMNEKLSRVIELLEDAVAALDKDRPVE